MVVWIEQGHSKPGYPDPLASGQRPEQQDNSTVTPTISVACVGCRRRKLRCNRQKPKCETCSKAQSECTYLISKRKVGVKRRSAKELGMRLGMVSEIITCFETYTDCVGAAQIETRLQPGGSVLPTHKESDGKSQSATSTGEAGETRSLDSNEPSESYRSGLHSSKKPRSSAASSFELSGVDSEESLPSVSLQHDL